MRLEAQRLSESDIDAVRKPDSAADGAGPVLMSAITRTGVVDMVISDLIAWPAAELVELPAVSAKRSRRLLKFLQGPRVPLARGRGVGARKRALKALCKPDPTGTFTTLHCGYGESFARFFGGEPLPLEGPAEVVVPRGHL